MAKYKYTDYFEKEVPRKRPYLRKEWCECVLDTSPRSTIGTASGPLFPSWMAAT
jgi:hypothetical protein